MDNLKSTLAVVFAGAAVGILLACSAPGAPAAEAPKVLPAATGTPAAPAPTPTAAATKAPAPVIVTPPAENEPPSVAKPHIQVSGRLIHTWYDKPGLRVILAIDGFTVQSRQEQLTARDGVIWFDEDEARKTGRVSLGIFAETGVEYHRAGGQVDKFDSVYLVMETTGELSLRSQEPERGKADNTELFLRAKKLRQEYLTQGVREQPTAVVPPAGAGARPLVPGVKEAGIPDEIRIVAQDDVRKVSFTSFIEDGVRISIWTGGVYIIRGDMEMAADNIVFWVPEEATKNVTGASGPPALPPAGSKPEAGPKPEAAPKPEPALTPTAGQPGFVTARIEPKAAVSGTAAAPPTPAAPAKGTKRVAVEAYLEGHVRLNRGGDLMQASQMFYDFDHERALAIDVKIHTFAKDRNVPVFYYAKEVRELAHNVFVGTDARLSTSAMAVPQYDLHAATLTIQELTPVPETPDENVQYRRVRFLGEDVAFEIHETPLTWWPKMAGDITEADTALRAVRFEHRSDRGVGLVTQWHLLKLLGVEQDPQDLDLYLDADYWSKRGPAVGVEGQYNQPNYYGQLLTYYLPHDTGTDSYEGQDVKPPNEERGRATWRHRAFLPDNWELTLEASYVSDATFMNEYFKREDETGKAQETLAYLKKQEQEQALWLLASTRVEDFYTRTEYYPQVGYDVIGHSFWDDRLTYYQDSEVAVARYLPHNPNEPFDPAGTGQQGLPPANSQLASPATFLFDTSHEVDLPMKFDNFNIVPFTEGRVSYFSDTPEGGGKWRLEAKEGARFSTQAWKVYNDVESEFWDLHRLRHVNIFDVTAYASQVSLHSDQLFPFAPTEDGTQEVVGVDGQDVLQAGWHQRFQTKRGVPDENGKQESVDWLTTDLEATFYSNRTYPNIGPDTGPEFNNLDFRAHWRATDTTSFWTDVLYNLDNPGVEKFDIGALITHTPRLSYTVGQRLIAAGFNYSTSSGVPTPQGASSITFVGFDYVINEKWRLSMLEEYDWDRGKFAHHDLVLTRRMERWIMRLKFSHDPGGPGSFVGVEFQPVGIKEIHVGW